MPTATSRPGGRPGRAFTLLSPFTPLAVAPGAQVSGCRTGRLALRLPHCSLVPAEAEAAVRARQARGPGGLGAQRDLENPCGVDTSACLYLFGQRPPRATPRPAPG